MTEKRFQTNEVGCIVDYQDNLKNYDGQEIVDLLNELHEENQLLKKHIRKLYEMTKTDVDSGIEVYPKTLSEYLLNILKILGDV